jgi:hypothetical protein
MTMTDVAALPSFGELRALARQPGIRSWIELCKQEILCRDWDIIPSPEAVKSLQGDYRAMRAYAARAAEALRFFRRPDPDFWNLNSWLGTLLEDLLVLDAAAVALMKPHGDGGGLFGSDIAGLRLIDAAITEPAIDGHGVLNGYILYGGEVPRRDFAAIASGPPEGLEVMHRYPADRCLYLSMTRRREIPWGFSPLERSVRVREDGSIDADATAAALAEGFGPDSPWRAAFPKFVKEALFDAVLDRCAGDSLRWQWVNET